jgi:hypothetical protein
MRRIEWIDIQDQAWFPRFRRYSLTESMAMGLRTRSFPQRVFPRPWKAPGNPATSRILDLCWGDTETRHIPDRTAESCREQA